MTQNESQADQKFLQVLWHCWESSNMENAMIALSIWEYLVTFDQEVDLVWKRKHRGLIPSVLLLTIRICMILNALVFSIVYLPGLSCKGMKVIDLVTLVMYVVGVIQTAIFSALRVSALYGRNVWLFLVVLILSLAPVPTNLYSLARMTIISFDGGQCTVTLEIPSSQEKMITLVTRVPLIIADALVLVLTWFNTFKQIVQAWRVGISVPLSTCLVRDGTLYFICLLVMNVLEIATRNSGAGENVGIFMAALPPVLINRFMLNLCEGNSMPDYPARPGLASLPTLRFRLNEIVVGNLGEALDHGLSAIVQECGESIAVKDMPFVSCEEAGDEILSSLCSFELAPGSTGVRIEDRSQPMVSNLDFLFVPSR